jgi:hypothetical protein
MKLALLVFQYHVGGILGKGEVVLDKFSVNYVAIIYTFDYNILYHYIILTLLLKKRNWDMGRITVKVQFYLNRILAMWAERKKIVLVI